MNETAAEREKRKVVIGLAQINNSFSGQNYLPYSVGVLQSYVDHNAPDPGRYEFLPPLFKRIRISEAVEHLIQADIVGLSTYVWNANISLEIARRLKARRPDILVVFGGPHVPDQPDEFLRLHRNDIDLCVHNEGEQTFLKILEEYPGRNWSRLNGISFLDGDGTLIKTPNVERLRDLSIIPSPFLDGHFDQLIAANPGETWIGLWETNRGCPFQCTYCDWGSSTSAKVNQFDINRLKQELEWFATHHIEFIFCCDANFGILKRDVDLAHHAAEVKRRTGYPRSLSVQNTKNATDRAYETQKILSDAGLSKGVALSMQSLDRQALVNIKRDNVSLDTYMELQRRFTEDGVETFSDLILALPGETYESFVAGVGNLIESGQHNRIQFNNLTILPNAEMAGAAYRAEFGLGTIESIIVNTHGSREVTEDDVPEYQEMVVSTASLPPEDWCRVRVFSWMTALTHFDKLLQIPFIVANQVGGMPYRHLIEGFVAVDGASYPVLGSIRDFFLDEAKRIQSGNPEYVYSEDWLGIYWPADEYIFIKLTAENNMDGFYQESFRLIANLLESRGIHLPEGVLKDALALNRALMKQPNVCDDLVLDLGYDLADFHRRTLKGQHPTLKAVKTQVRIDRSSKTWPDFQVWCQEVVWWGNKKGAYLYGANVLDRRPSGHH
ncbi:MAG: cobalamin-dependent protein [Alphaproteobacteria bacterium]|nr:cobalamin-dependent protein [Alphaproteobacteria bacterium]